MLTVALALAAPLVGFAEAYFLIFQHYARNPEMQKFALYLTAGLLTVALIAAIAVGILIAGSVVPMLILKLIAWLVGWSLSWSLAWAIGLAISGLAMIFVRNPAK